MSRSTSRRRRARKKAAIATKRSRSSSACRRTPPSSHATAPSTSSSRSPPRFATARTKSMGVVLVFRDITERQRNEAERRKAETLEQLGLLAGGIAHDFNNLLTAIIGNISLASLLLPPNDEMATRLNDAKNASMRARDLAQQLLTFARGGAPIKKTASIGKLIQDTVSFSLARHAQPQRIHLRRRSLAGRDRSRPDQPGHRQPRRQRRPGDAEWRHLARYLRQLHLQLRHHAGDPRPRCRATTSASRSATKASAFRKTTSSASSIRISRPRRKATASASRRPTRSSRTTTASSPSTRRCTSVPPSRSTCRRAQRRSAGRAAAHHQPGHRRHRPRPDCR